MEDGDNEFSEDYYALLNVSKNATDEDISRAFRNLSKIYHPDRHVDSERKQEAESLFLKIRKAHEILTDPHKRAIYDAVGQQGLDVEGWELVARQFSPEEIGLEYERLRRLHDEDELRKSVNPSGLFEVIVNVTELFIPRTSEDSEFESSFPSIEMSGMNMAQSVEAPVSVNDRLLLNGSLQLLNGVGGGNLNLTWRRLISQLMWAEFEVSGGEQLKTSCKFTRTFSKFMYGSIRTSAKLYLDAPRLREMIEPGIEFALNRQLDVHVRGSLALKLGHRQSVTTSLIYNDNRKRQVILALILGIPVSYIVLSATQRLTENDGVMHGSIKTGGTWLMADAGYERQISKYSRFGCDCRVVLPAGNIRVKLKVLRASQTYQLDLVLCEQMDYALSSFLYGVMVPWLGYMILKQMLRPYFDKWQDTSEWQKQMKSKEATELRRKEAKQTVELMRETGNRIKIQEEKKKGLVIMEARYGDFFSTQSNQYSFNSGVIDVTIPLQTLVVDSKLMLCDASKSQLPGFYDPCPGTEKILQVRYRFRGYEHRVTFKDSQSVFIPKQSHKTD